MSLDWDRIKGALAKAEKALSAAGGLDGDRLRELLQRRAAALASRARASAGGEESLAVLVFQLGRERYGVDLASLSQVVAAEGLVHVPGGPEGLLGVMSLRGEVGSVWDLARLLGLPQEEARSGGHVLVLRAELAIGLRVDRAEGNLELQAGALIPAGGIDEALPARLLKGILAPPGRDRLLLLDADALAAEIAEGG